MKHIVFITLFSILVLSESHSGDRIIEARRNYDLGISYIKSDLYEDGIKTLNQVAFLYPDSDVADDALFQLALIREQVAENEIVVGVQESIETVKQELNDLTENYSDSGKVKNFLVFLNAILAGDNVLESAKIRAIAEYILALDYLMTLIQRYPESNRLPEAKLKAEEIMNKIDALIPKQQFSPPKKPHPEGCLIILAILGIFSAIVFIDKLF